MSKKLFIDNAYQLKNLSDEYQKAYERFYQFILKKDYAAEKSNVLLNLVIDACMNGMSAGKKAIEVIPNDLKSYLNQLLKSKTYLNKIQETRKNDYEKFHIASIWMVFSVAIVLFFLKNLIDGKFLIHYLVDAAIGCIGGAIAVSQFLIKRRVVERYQFGSYVYLVDAAAVLLCVLIKMITPSNFDITYLILVLAFFIEKKKIKNQFESLK